MSIDLDGEPVKVKNQTKQMSKIIKFKEDIQKENECKL